jgi:hypothetical protein
LAWITSELITQAERTTLRNVTTNIVKWKYPDKDHIHLYKTFLCPKISSTFKLSLLWMFLIPKCMPGVFVSFYTNQLSTYSRVHLITMKCTICLAFSVTKIAWIEKFEADIYHVHTFCIYDIKYWIYFAKIHYLFGCSLHSAAQIVQQLPDQLHDLNFTHWHFMLANHLRLLY